MKKILLKLSGEAMAGSNDHGIDPEFVKEIALEIKEIVASGNEVAVVIGGGNIWRGQTGADLGMDRSTADYMGMLVTVMNSLALQDALEKVGCGARVMTSLHANQVAEPYIKRKAIKHMEKGRVIMLAGGTGMPYFSTDTNAMVKAAELGIDMVLMAKNGTEGVYDKDPNAFNDAVMFETLDYDTIVEKELRVMDLTAATMAKENNLTSVVFNMNEKGNILKVVNGAKLGTTIKNV